MFKIEKNRMVASLFSEMEDALRAMQSGDYDRAYRILEARVEPGQPRASAAHPEWMNDLGAIRLLRMLIQDAPIPVLSGCELLAQPAAAVASIVLAGNHDAERIAVANSFLADFGFVLAWRDPETDAGS